MATCSLESLPPLSSEMSSFLGNRTRVAASLKASPCLVMHSPPSQTCQQEPCIQRKRLGPSAVSQGLRPEAIIYDGEDALGC